MFDGHFYDACVIKSLILRLLKSKNVFFIVKTKKPPGLVVFVNGRKAELGLSVELGEQEIHKLRFGDILGFFIGAVFVFNHAVV